MDGVRTGKLPSEIPPRMTALPAPGKTTVPPEIARERIAQINAILYRKLTTTEAV